MPSAARQEVAFLGLWWLVDEVQYDLTSVNPQAAGMGDFMKNAVVEVTLVGSGRAAVTGIGHPKIFLDIVGQQVKGGF